MSSIDFVPAGMRAGAISAARALENLDNVLIAAHTGLDGDALGSMAAAGWMFRALGRSFALYSSTGVPAHLDFLPLPGAVYGSLAEIPFECSSALFLDCSEPQRLGAELEGRARDFASVNIDHHLGGCGLGSLCNYICPQAAATAQLMGYVALALGLPVGGALGESIALGLITDTGGFCHGNTTGPVFSLCALLAEAGCDFSAIRERLQHVWLPGRMRLWGRAFCRARQERGKSIAFCSISRDELAACHCLPEDTEGLVEWLRRLRGTRVSALLREESDGLCKFSLRSTGSVDVRAIAAALGGGGHLNAAGGRIEAQLPEAEAILLKAVCSGLDAAERAE